MIHRNFQILFVFVGIFVAFTIAKILAHVATDWLWFENLGYANAYKTMAFSRFGSFLGFGLFFLALAILNVSIARRFGRRTREMPLEALDSDSSPDAMVELLRERVGWIVVLGGASCVMGIGGTPAWTSVLRFLNPSSFGLNDPIFGNEVGWYVFRLPLLNFVYFWLIGALAMIALLVMISYYRDRSIRHEEERWHTTPYVRAHYSALGAALVLVLGYGYWLKIYEILYSFRKNAFFGAGYTDLTTQVFAFRLMIFLSVGFAALLVYNLRYKGWRYPRNGAVTYVCSILVFSWIIPILCEQFVVKPNELRLESSYIQHCIDYTRKAYLLEQVEETTFPANAHLSPSAIDRNEATLASIPLWDRRPLMDTYGQLQEIRTYYQFSGVDVDRYPIDGHIRQVMLAAREFSHDQLALQSDTWVNRHLVYTHGYGICMTPANAAGPDGLPTFFIKDIPPVSSIDLKIDRPEIYFGEDMRDYIIVKTRAPEFNYPKGDENIYADYTGNGGVALDSVFRKLLFAARFTDPFIFITGNLTDQSRIIFDRHIGTEFNEVDPRRFAKLAPFLKFDSDPYLVVVGGRLKWIQDAYTVTNMFPYSEPYGRPFVRELNYIRNSVKAVMDAYDGSVDFYVWDATDPIIQTYRIIFPGLFKNQSEMPESIRAHIRYPIDLFRTQSALYNSYHMTSPQVFYNKEDVWEPATEIYGVSEQTLEVRPYYLVTRLPDSTEEEFVLMLPTTPRGKANMIAWMIARSDGSNYGRLMAYKFPKEKLIYGPMLVERRIDQDTDVSREITLWSQRGSDVIRGNLLVIPIEDSFIYVEPLYLRASQAGMPELKRVLVVHDEKVVMEKTLELALQKAFSRDEETQPSDESGIALPSPGLKMLLKRARSEYDEAQARLKTGNFQGYGESIDQLGKTLEQMSRNQSDD
ncbi:MAG: UPF0182 family protein [Candidatus Latescibacterota bacterium]|nr:UPF0182 family protein [Candidatus Latescibacterota bacterium]